MYRKVTSRDGLRLSLGCSRLYYFCLNMFPILRVIFFFSSYQTQESDPLPWGIKIKGIFDYPGKYTEGD